MNPDDDVPPIEDPDVASLFDSYPAPIREDLLNLRRLVLSTASEIDSVGPIEETTRWGQPGYLTSTTRTGSTIRLGPTAPRSSHDYGLYFICRTSLVETFRHLFGDLFDYEDNRALLFTTGEPIPQDELAECIALALTYHLDKATQPTTIHNQTMRNKIN